jgi:hypothetical protein
MRKPKVIILEETKQNAVHWWRQLRPWTAMEKAGHCELLIQYDTLKQQDLLRADVIVFSGGIGKAHVDLAEIAHAHGIKVWHDFDDDVRAVTRYNLHHEGTKKNLPFSMGMLGAADIVTTSTEELKEFYSDIRNDIQVLPNAIYEHEIADGWNIGFECLWRGGRYGMRDVWVNMVDLQKIGKMGCRMTWWGDIPYFMPEDQLFTLGWTDINLFFPMLKKLAPSYVWKPLEDTQFNKAKSNIALLESCVAGALCITNDKGEKWKPAITAEQARDNVDSWKAKRFREQADFVRELYNIEKVNEKRLEILKGI